MPVSTTVAPDSKLYRTVVANDVGPFATKNHGLNAGHYRTVHIEILPAGGPNPAVEVLWWSEEAGLFVPEHTPLTRAGLGANLPYAFTVEAQGRILFVAVTGGIAAGSVKIATSGYNIDHTL